MEQEFDPGLTLKLLFLLPNSPTRGGLDVQDKNRENETENTCRASLEFQGLLLQPQHISGCSLLLGQTTALALPTIKAQM